MKSLVVLVLIISLFNTVSGQDENTFFFRDQIKDTANLNLDYSLMKSHYLGDPIARKMYRLEKTYTFTEAPTAMSPTTKTVVKKPTIYYAVLKLNTLYKKQLKKDQITEADAIKKLGKTLDLAYNMFPQDTEKFETYLKTIKTPQDIEKAFEKVKLY